MPGRRLGLGLLLPLLLPLVRKTGLRLTCHRRSSIYICSYFGGLQQAREVHPRRLLPAYLVDTTYYHLAVYLRSQVQLARRRTIGLFYRQTVPGRLQYQAATPTASLPDSLQQLD